MSRLDIIIFGASGYTGTFVVRELAKIFSNEKLTWAIAGRSINKLKTVLDSVSKEQSMFFFTIICFFSSDEIFIIIKNILRNRFE